MALKEYPLDDPLAQELWADRLLAENFSNVQWTKFIGDESSLVYLKNDFQKGTGSQLTFGLRLQIDQTGSLDNELMEGNEGNYQTVEHTMVIRQLRFAVEGTGAIDRQRIGFDDREQCRSALTELWTRRDETAFFNQLCGASYQTNVRFTGLNAVHDPGPHGENDTNHYLLKSGVANEQSLGTSDKFSTALIDQAVERAKSSNFGPPIRPLRIDGKDYYIMWIHTYSAQDLRNDSDWKSAQLAAMQGGAINNNPIFTGALGVWNNVILYESDYVANGLNASTGAQLTTVRRAVLCGAQCMCLGYGKKGGSSTTMFWREREIDYGNRLGVMAGKIYGMSVSTFDFDQNGTDQRLSSIVIPVYAAAHS